MVDMLCFNTVNKKLIDLQFLCDGWRSGFKFLDL